MSIRDWFGGRTEQRQGAYTNAIVEQIIARAKGSTDAQASGTAALEACAGAVGRAFAAADVSGPAFAQAALTPTCLAFIGRQLVRRGETVMMIDVPTGRLVAGCSWDIQGELPESSWTYRLSLPAPSAVITRNLSGDGVVHVRYSVDPDRPWAGVGPLQAASLAGKLSANVAGALAAELGTTMGFVLPLPVDGNDPTLTALKADLRGSSGGLHPVESARTMNPGGAATAPGGDWKVSRLGPNPPAPEVALLGESFREVAAACGVPLSLFTDADGTGARESYRRFLHATVVPLAKLAAAELSAKLDGAVSLSFDSLFAGDLSGRARSFQSLVGAGMDITKAAGLAGLMESEG